MKRREKAQRLVAEALSLAPRQRESFLAAACRGDEELESSILIELEVHAGGPDFLRPPFEQAAESAGEPGLDAGRSDATVDVGATATGAADPPAVHSGQVLSGRFRLGQELGRGGMGVVFSARDLQLERDVAVKVVHAHHRQSDAAAWEQEVLAESRTLAALSSRGIVNVLDVRRDGPLTFLVMDRIEGVGLESLVARARAASAAGRAADGALLAELIGLEVPAEREDLIVPDDWWRSVARIAAKMLGALAAAHERGVIHRDLKPGNVLLVGGGEPVLLDFGISLRPGSSATDLRGTPAYLPPEAAESMRASEDLRSDLYQVGLILYELLTLQPAFRTDTSPAIEVLERVKSGARAAVLERAPECPAALAAICEYALRLDPAQRYASANDMRRDLERFERGLPPRIAPLPALTAWRLRAGYCARHPVTLASLAALVLAFGVWVTRPTETSPLTVEAFLHRRGAAQPTTLERKARLKDPGESLLGLTVRTQAPLYLYVLSLYGAESEADELLARPLRPEPFPPTAATTGNASPGPLLVEAGTTRVTCALIEAPHPRERLVAFLCAEESRPLDAWYRALEAESDGGRLAVGWSRAKDLFQSLGQRTRGQSPVAFSPDEHAAWFGALTDEPAPDEPGWELDGTVRFDFEYEFDAPASRSSESRRFPYRLAALDARSGRDVEGTVHAGQQLQFSLQADAIAEPPEPRHVYLVARSSDGAATLIYPRPDLNIPDRPLPAPGTEALTTLRIPHLELDVGPPYGTDTYVWFATRAPLDRPFELETLLSATAQAAPAAEVLAELQAALAPLDNAPCGLLRLLSASK